MCNIIKKRTHLTPESEVLHFGFEVPNISDLRAILSVKVRKQNVSVTRIKELLQADLLYHQA